VLLCSPYPTVYIENQKYNFEKARKQLTVLNIQKERSLRTVGISVIRV
jgi:hypothetical protein